MRISLTLLELLCQMVHRPCMDHVWQHLQYNCATISLQSSVSVRRYTMLQHIIPRCCPTVKQSAAERHVGIVNVCFQVTFEDPSLQSFLLQISNSTCAVCSDFIISDTIINLFYLLTYLHHGGGNLYCRQNDDTTLPVTPYIRLRVTCFSL